MLHTEFGVRVEYCSVIHTYCMYDTTRLELSVVYTFNLFLFFVIFSIYCEIGKFIEP